MESLNSKELRNIIGGIIPLAVAWGICKVVCVVSAGAYGAGYAIGKAHAHYENNKK